MQNFLQKTTYYQVRACRCCSDFALNQGPTHECCDIKGQVSNVLSGNKVLFPSTTTLVLYLLRGILLRYFSATIAEERIGDELLNNTDVLPLFLSKEVQTYRKKDCSKPSTHSNCL